MDGKHKLGSSTIDQIGKITFNMKFLTVANALRRRHTCFSLHFCFIQDLQPIMDSKLLQ